MKFGGDVDDINPEFVRQKFFNFSIEIVEKYRGILKDTNTSEMLRVISIDGYFRKKYLIPILMIEILLVECPANVYAESMGHHSNVIRDSLRKRLGISVLDALMLVSKNSPGEEFWEEHLDYLVKIWKDVIGGHYSLPQEKYMLKNNIDIGKMFSVISDKPRVRRSGNL